MGKSSNMASARKYIIRIWPFKAIPCTSCLYNTDTNVVALKHNDQFKIQRVKHTLGSDDNYNLRIRRL